MFSDQFSVSAKCKMKWWICNCWSTFYKADHKIWYLKDTVTVGISVLILIKVLCLLQLSKIKWFFFHQKLDPPSKKFDGETLIFAPNVFLCYDLVIYFNVQQFWFERDLYIVTNILIHVLNWSWIFFFNIWDALCCEGIVCLSLSTVRMYMYVLFDCLWVFFPF